MKQRLQVLLEQEGLSPVRFAEIVGVQRSSVSHILSGRNNPSLDFIQKILEAFPKVSSDWLISGKGSVYRDQSASVNTVPNQASNIPISAPKTDQTDLFSAANPTANAVPELKQEPASTIAATIGTATEAEIEQIVVFYKDKSFRSYLPKG